MAKIKYHSGEPKTIVQKIRVKPIYYEFLGLIVILFILFLILAVVGGIQVAMCDYPWRECLFGKLQGNSQR